MLEIIVPGVELYDSQKNEFLYTESTVLKLEHSLLAISKWEEIWETPFLSKIDGQNRTPEQILSYIKCMTINKVNDDVYNRLTEENIDDIYKYINSNRTATKISDNNKKADNGHYISAEVIYAWMINLRMDVNKFEKWHINKLLTLITVTNEQNQPKKKQSTAEVTEQYRKLKAARRAKKKLQK